MIRSEFEVEMLIVEAQKELEEANNIKNRKRIRAQTPVTRGEMIEILDHIVEDGSPMSTSTLIISLRMRWKI